MNKSEMERRDQVLRAYFQGRDWDENNEFKLRQAKEEREAFRSALQNFN